MARKSKLDRMVEAAAADLAAVRRRELSPLTGAEKRAVLGNVLLGGARVVRGRGPGAASGRVDRAWEAAEDRLEGELTALVRLRSTEQQSKAADRVAQRLGGRK